MKINKYNFDFLDSVIIYKIDFMKHLPGYKCE